MGLENLIIFHGRGLCRKLIVTYLLRKVSAFLEFEDSLPCSKACDCNLSWTSSFQFPFVILFLHIILSYRLRSAMPYFISCSLIKYILYISHFLLTATCAIHIILPPTFNVIKILCKAYNQFLNSHYLVTVNILLLLALVYVQIFSSATCSQSMVFTQKSDMRFLQLWVSRLLLSEMWCHVIWYRRIPKFRWNFAACILGQADGE
jgi:hypothetical protein